MSAAETPVPIFSAVLYHYICIKFVKPSYHGMLCQSWPRLHHNFNFLFPDWFYHAPAAKAEGPSCTVAPAPSQIPGLSNIPDNSVVEQDERCFRRKWVRDTDSKYVKLAKAGGRKRKFENW